MTRGCTFSRDVELEIERIQNSALKFLSKAPSKLPKKSQLQDLIEAKKKAEKDCNEAKIAMAGLCEDVIKVKEEFDALKKENVFKFLQFSQQNPRRRQEECSIQEKRTNQDKHISKKKAELLNELTLLENTKFNSHDKELVEKTKFQYKCIRNITQLRFEYSTSDDNVLKGFVFNKVTTKVTSFSINLSEMDSDQVQQRLMKLMKDTSHPIYGDISLK